MSAQGHIANENRHVPVLCAEVIGALNVRDGGVYVDGTFGAGGYSRAILDAADCSVVAVDRDPDAIAGGQALVDAYAGRLTLLQGQFGNMAELLSAAGIGQVDGVTLDLGVSSMQLDQAERGFSFQKDGPLDMRMSQEGESAADLVNQKDEAELADILYYYGEERQSRRIARAIVRARQNAPITRTSELADIVEHVLPRRKPGDSHPATRSFQGLRIAVNAEFDELKVAMEKATKLLKTSGWLVVVSFHSLEDRIVKQFFNEAAGKNQTVNRHEPLPQNWQAPTLKIVTRKPVTASDHELNTNPRARSAKVRVAQKLEVAA